MFLKNLECFHLSAPPRTNAATLNENGEFRERVDLGMEIYDDKGLGNLDDEAGEVELDDSDDEPEEVPLPYGVLRRKRTFEPRNDIENFDALCVNFLNRR